MNEHQAEERLSLKTRYWLIVRVGLRQPIEAAGEGGGRLQLAGYYQDFGVTASTPADARSIVAAAVEDGDIDWKRSSCEVADFNRLNQEVKARSSDPNLVGIWYKSGRGLFPGPDEMEEDDQLSTVD